MSMNPIDIALAQQLSPEAVSQFRAEVEAQLSPEAAAKFRELAQKSAEVQEEVARLTSSESERLSSTLEEEMAMREKLSLYFMGLLFSFGKELMPESPLEQ